MPTLIHLIAQRVFRSGGARADRDVGVFGYACFALVEYPCCRNWFGVEGRGGKGEKGKERENGKGGGAGGARGGGVVFGGEGCDGEMRGGRGVEGMDGERWGRTLVGFFAGRGAGLLDLLGDLVAEISGGCVRGGAWGVGRG